MSATVTITGQSYATVTVASVVTPPNANLGRIYNTPAEAQAATVPAAVGAITVVGSDGQPRVYRRGGSDLTTGDGATWTVAIEYTVPEVLKFDTLAAAQAATVGTTSLIVVEDAGAARLYYADPSGGSLITADGVIFRRVLADGEVAPPSVPQVAHVFLLGGQSNGTSRADWDGGADWPADGTVRQWSRSAAPRTANADATLVNAARPLDHWTQNAPGGGSSEERFGFALQFVLDYLAANPGVNVVLIPGNYGGTGFTFGSPLWGVGQTLSEDLIARANAVLAANPLFELKGLLWHQGERDRDADPAVYEAALDAQFAEFRSRITGATTMPVVVSPPADGYTDGGVAAIKTVINETPSRVTNSAVALVAGLGTSDGVHFDAAAMRSLGSNYYYAFQLAAAGGATVPGTPGPASWSVASKNDPAGNVATISINQQVLYRGGFPLRYEYRVNGGAATTLVSPPATGSFDVTVPIANNNNTFEVRAVNTVGAGAWSGIRTVFITDTQQVPNTPGPLAWDVRQITPDGLGNNVEIQLISNVLGNGDGPDDYVYDVNSDNVQRSIGGIAPRTVNIALPVGPEHRIRIAATNSGGAGAWSGFKSITLS